MDALSFRLASACQFFPENSLYAHLYGAMIFATATEGTVPGRLAEGASTCGLTELHIFAEIFKD